MTQRSNARTRAGGPAATARHAGIVSHSVYPIHTRRREGINNQIKVIERQAYGFRDDGYFILKIEGALPGSLPLNPR